MCGWKVGFRAATISKKREEKKGGGADELWIAVGEAVIEAAVFSREDLAGWSVGIVSKGGKERRKSW